MIHRRHRAPPASVGGCSVSSWVRWVIPNCQFRSKTARLKTFTANQIDEIKDPSGLFYILPFQKGYLVNWDVQRQVWDYLFGKEMYQVDFLDTNIIITEPYFNFTSIQESMNEILFEEYQFQAVLRVNVLAYCGMFIFPTASCEQPVLSAHTGISEITLLSCAASLSTVAIPSRTLFLTVEAKRKKKQLFG